MKEDRYYSRSYSRQQKTINVVIQIVLLVLGIMWILPLMWIILTSFRAEPGSYTSYAATIGILVFIICSLLSLITFRRSASYKNEEAFQ